MGLQLSVFLSFSIIILLSIIYGSSSIVHAQLTNFSSVAIPMTSSVNIVQIKQQQEQQSNNNNSSSSPSSPFVFPSHSPNIRNPLPIMSTSSFSGNYPNFQLPPIANAGYNQTVTAGSTVILNASKSKSPNGIILGYSWKQIPTSSINLGAVNSPVWDFTAPRVTTNTLLQFQLNVTDNWGQTNTSFVNVLDKPTMAIHALSLSSSLPQATTVTKTVTSNNQNKAQNYLVNIPTNYNTQKLPSPQKEQQQQLQQPPPLVPPISNPR